MNATVETLEDNKVKLSITVDEQDFEKDIDAAFKRIAHEVNIPGFRPGKAPRKLLEKRIGRAPAREEALREALPKYYADAVVAHDVDVIAAPEIDITSEEDDAGVVFDAVVEVRPVVKISGYEAMEIVIANPEASDKEIAEQFERMRAVDATLGAVDRPAEDGDSVTIDITGTLDGEVQDGLTTDDYSYEIGSGIITPEVDDQLRGSSAGDELEFDATHPDEDEDRSLTFKISVKEVKAKVLPELDDAWAADNSEFETVAEMEADLRTRMATVRRAQGATQLQEKTAEALGKLVELELPESLVSLELQNRMQDLGMRLQAQGIDFNQYLMMTGQSQEDMLEQLRESAQIAARVDLALRAVVEAEGIECTEEDLDIEIEGVAERVGEKPAKVRKQLDRNDQLPAVRSDIRKRKALEWLLERVTVVDEDGNPLDRSIFEPDADEETDEAAESGGQAEDVTAADDESDGEATK